MIDISLENDIFITTPLKKFIQEIDVLMNTTLTSVLGEPGFGSNYEQFLWSMTDASSQIEQYTTLLINNNAPSANLFLWDCGCTCVQDDNGEQFYYLIIAIHNPDTKNIERSTYLLHNYGDVEKPVIKSISMNF